MLIFFKILSIFFIVTYPCVFSAENVKSYIYSGGIETGTIDGNVPAFEESNKTYKRKVTGSENGSADYYLLSQEAPLFFINRDNFKKYTSYLSPGLRSLINKYPSLNLPVYKTYRSLDYPSSIKSLIKNKSKIKKNIKIESNVFVPFKYPKTGSEVILNHLSRYRGGSEEKKTHSFVVNAKGSFSKVGIWSKRVSSTYMKGGNEKIAFYVIAKYFEPPALIGDIFLVHEPFVNTDLRRKAWIYSSAQRRVRRAPDAAYDATGRGSQGLITADQIDGFNGSLDRYNWKLIGKKTLLVPYNFYLLHDKNIRYTNIFGKNCVEEKFLRFEFHRVWVVEARLKKDSRHIYGKRVFYVDEDSWSILSEDSYSVRGDLWRVSVHGLLQVMPENFPWYRAHIHFDLSNKSCFVSGLDNELKNRPVFGFNSKLKSFTPNAMRRFSTN
jgi:hypothetical protein